MRPTRALRVGIWTGTLVLLLAFPAVGASQPPRANPQKLWNEYPLDPGHATAPTPRADAPRPAPTAPAQAAPGNGGAPRWRPLALGAAALTLLILAAIALRGRSERRRTSAAPVRVEAPEQLIAHARALAREAAECDKYLHRRRVGRTRGMSETADHDLPAAPVAPSDRGSTSTYAGIGDRVAGVLAAAESAANQIRDDASASAQEILSAAREDAAQLRGEASAYESDTRAAVDSYASDRRREAEQDVQTLLVDSEGQARATRQAAEAMARQIEEAGRQRADALREESRAVEERLKKALTGLRRMAAELEDLLSAPADDGESLVDALKPYGQRDGEQAGVAATRSHDA